MQPQKHGRSWRTSSTLEHHSPGGAPATVTCSYIEAGRWILGWGNLVHDTTTMPGPCSEKSASPREGRGHCAAGVPPCRRRSAVGNQWAGWGSIPVVLSLGWQVTCVSSYVRCPFPSKETRRILERDDPGPPVVQGGQGIGLGSRNLERAGR
jgi:hypothetical protein